MKPDPRQDVAVQTWNLTKRFDSFTAVDHVSMQVQAGEVLGFLGPNGSGKTTTIRMLLGLLLPSEGSARVLGLDVSREPEAIRQQVGYMSQRFALYDELTASENLSFYAGVYGVRERGPIDRTMAALGVGDFAGVRAGELPLGWRQRLALATAVVHQPALVFLDEPTSGVDPSARRTFWDLIYALVDEGITAFVTTHYMDEAEYCDQVGIMRRGKLLAMDTPSALKRDYVPGSIWHVAARPQQSALAALTALAEVHQVSFSGADLRIIADPGVEAAILRQALERQGIEVVRAEPAATNMEDVFLGLATD